LIPTRRTNNEKFDKLGKVYETFRFGQPNHPLLKEKIMAQNQSPAKSTAEGELSLDDLEKIAGGTNTESAASFLANRANKVEQSKSLSVTHNSPQLENPEDVGA
jgi:hypothetical protein